jgi:aminopeptidase
MKDPRMNRLANLVINHSCAIKPGERLLIEGINVPNDMIIEVIREAKRIGGVPLVSIKDDKIIRELCSCYSQEDISLMADCELYTLNQMHAFVGIRGILNGHELSDVPPNNLKTVMEHYIRPVHMEVKHQNTKWVVLRWPTQAMAQQAKMSTEAFEDFYFDACTMDYARMETAMEPLVDIMKQTDMVRVSGPGDTDVSFSIQNMPQCKCAGRHNLPDGELLTTPIRESVNGRICYNVPSFFYGTLFEDVCFTFSNGKIVVATSNHTEKLNQILDYDPGARYIGEFAFGLNPHILRPMNDVLFDEKIMGSLHLVPGNAYKECDNGNRSAIHWDLVLMQTTEMGGGEVYFDDILVRKDGMFVLEALQGLNYL